MDDILKSLLLSPDGISAIVSQYKPILYTICNEFFGIYKDLLNNDDWFVANAKYERKRFEALVNEGFTEDQAMQIVLARIQDFKNYAQRTSGASVTLRK